MNKTLWRWIWIESWGWYVRFFLAHIRTTITDTKQILLLSTGQKSSPTVTVSLFPSHSFSLPVLSTTPSLTQGTHSFSQRTPHLFTNLAETPAANVSPFQERLKNSLFCRRCTKTHWHPQCCSSFWGFLGKVPEHWRPEVTPAFVTVCIVLCQSWLLLALHQRKAALVGSGASLQYESSPLPADVSNWVHSIFHRFVFAWLFSFFDSQHNLSPFH